MWECLGYLGKTNYPRCLQWACSFKPWEILSVYLFPTAMQHRLAWTWWMAAFHWQSIMSRQYIPGKKICLCWECYVCVTELFNERTVFCLFRNAVVDHTEFAISWTSGNLLPLVSISFLPVVLYPRLHLDALMWSCGFWEHIDWPNWEKGRISNRFLKTGG